MSNLKIRKTFTALAIAGVMVLTPVSLTGCIPTEVYDSNVEDFYDVIDSQGENVEIKPQVLDVPGESFKLVVEYSLDDNSKTKWRITDNKKISVKVYTQGLPEGTKVYIDNVHTDTTLIASKEQMNGITQDSMDDRIHNSLMLGFPISDTTCFYAINEIEGQNDSFISGSFYGFNGISSGSIEQERYTEEDYLKNGVFGNKIASVYGLLIQKGDNEPYGVDVSSDVVVLACNKIEKKYSDGTVEVKIYNRDGSYEKEAKESAKEKVKTKE